MFPTQDTWIDGRPERSAVAEDTHLHDPGTGEPLAAVLSSSPEQLERAIAAATAAHESGQWAGLGTDGRGEILLAFADAIDACVDELGRLDALNSGVPHRLTALFAGSLGGTIRTAVALGRELGDVRDLPADQGAVRLHRVPWGPAALVAPWNAPSAVAGKKMAYALMAGAPVVLKPSPAAPWSAQLLMAAAVTAGLPAGTVNLVLGGAPVGAALCADPRIRAISMTGSTGAGRSIAAAAAGHFTRLQLELGSTNPVIVAADADVESTADALYSGFTKLNGQWCEAPRIVFADRVVAGDLVDALAARAGKARLGGVFDPDTEIGPMAYAGRRDELVAQRDALAAQGHTVLPAVDVPPTGWFVAPTVVTGTGITPPGEVFGPILAVESMAGEAEAVARATAVGGGLGAYVFSADLERAHALGARLPAGEVKINGTSLLDMSPESAQSFFGGSGIGGHGDRDVLDFFLGKRVVGLDLFGPPL